MFFNNFSLPHLSLAHSVLLADATVEKGFLSNPQKGYLTEALQTGQL
jgi:hypothetical protein